MQGHVMHSLIVYSRSRAKWTVLAPRPIPRLSLQLKGSLCAHSTRILLSLRTVFTPSQKSKIWAKRSRKRP